jgi:alpha-glucuronidase
MVEFQITQEYLGQANHLVFLAPLFKETWTAILFQMEKVLRLLKLQTEH